MVLPNMHDVECVALCAYSVCLLGLRKSHYAFVDPTMPDKHESPCTSQVRCL
jgi:hypothetical protein